MILFPAIDVMNGRAVRLYQGDKNKATDYGDPLAFAEKWVEAGAEWLHIVDLSGAFTGASGIDSLIGEIKKRFPVRVQSGGGLRRIVDIRRRLDAGADRVVIGTMAVTDPDSFALACFEFPEKIVAGIDAKDGMFAVQGWTVQTDIRADEFAKKCKCMGIRCALFTDISKDGAMAGAIGGGGLGKIAINYGYNKYNYAVMLIAVIFIVILVQIFQSLGTWLAVRSDKRLTRTRRRKKLKSK